MLVVILESLIKRLDLDIIHLIFMLPPSTNLNELASKVPESRQQIGTVKESYEQS